MHGCLCIVNTYKMGFGKGQNEVDVVFKEVTDFSGSK